MPTPLPIPPGAVTLAARQRNVTLTWVAVEPPENLPPFLSPEEQAQLARLRIPKRRGEWASARWAAKQAVASRFSPTKPLSLFPQDELRSLPSGQPVFAQPGLGVSLAHAGGTALAAVWQTPETLPPTTLPGVGIDLEPVTPVHPALEAMVFTPLEREWLADQPERASALLDLWCVKEAAVKALGQGWSLPYLAVTARPLKNPFSGAAGPHDGEWQGEALGKPFRAWSQGTLAHRSFRLALAYLTM
ncbi:MAG: 4'-phosphopantetheinyl transferase superfamily protein [Deltaproteobacteria bacterium]|nr:4'-phosphopantetheinyl transferase superfamily protein [Deltaproteobacteria bacterium]